MVDEQPADDLPERVELSFAGLDQSGADVVPEAEVASRRLGVAGPRLGLSARPRRRTAELSAATHWSG